MRQKSIPGTDLSCSMLSLGSVFFGSTISEEDSFRLMDMYVERGGNMVDTAQVYANWLLVATSASEKTIGRWMKARKNRHRLVVTTKGAHPDPATMHISRMSPRELAADLDGSLMRLGVDCIDLYWLHRDDPNIAAGEILETLNGFVKAGKIRYFGCSNWTIARIDEAQRYAKEKGIQGFAANQMMWSLAYVERASLSDPTLVPMDADMKNYHAETGLAAIPYTSQAEGLFTKWESGLYTFDDSRIKPYFRSAENVRRFYRARELAAELSLTVSQVVLAYLVSQPFTTIPIIGCRTPEMLIDSLAAADVVLTPEQLAFLES
ncbi:MAG TPA: aldo/keto reductase [Bacilli bacterium]